MVGKFAGRLAWRLLSLSSGSLPQPPDRPPARPPRSAQPTMQPTAKDFIFLFLRLQSVTGAAYISQINHLLSVRTVTFCREVPFNFNEANTAKNYPCFR